MNCVDVKQHLADLLYGELAGEMERDLRTHIGECPSCRAELQRLEKAHGALAAGSPALADRRVNVPAIYQRAIAQTEARGRRWRMAAVLGGTAAVALLLLSMIGVRIEGHPTHVVIAWGAVPSPKAASPSTPDPWPTLNQQSEQLKSLDQLAQLTARELLDIDNRQSAALARLNAELRALSAESDRRSILIVGELQRQDAELALARSDNLPQPVGREQ